MYLPYIKFHSLIKRMKFIRDEFSTSQQPYYGPCQKVNEIQVSNTLLWEFIHLGTEREGPQVYQETQGAFALTQKQL